MSSPDKIDIGAVLAAAYRRPDTGLDQVATRVRARLALVETVGECFRLLIEVPGFALSASLPASMHAEGDGNEESGDDEHELG